MNIFKLSRIKLDEILQDISTFTSDIYGQSKSVYSPASAWGQIILVLSRIAHLIFYYIEDSITELSLSTATREANVKSLIQLTGHNVTRPISATGDVYVTPIGIPKNINGQHVIIPNFTKLLCKTNGLSYLLVTNQNEYKVNIYNDKSRFLAKIIQGELEQQTFTGTGEELQSFECNMTPGREIDNFFVNVFVNGEKYKIYDSLYDMPKDAPACLVRTGLTSGIDIFFGNGNFGKIPAVGSEIIVEYLISSGALGNISSITDIVFEFETEGKDNTGETVDLNSVFSISINNPVSFGSDGEPLKLSKMLGPKHSRNFVLGTKESFKIFFEKFQMFSTIKIYNEYKPSDLVVDNVVYVLLVPDLIKRMRSGENYFTVPQSFFSLSQYEKNKISKMIEESQQKMFTTIVKFVDPQFKKYSTNIYINIWKGYSKDSIYETVISKLSDYFINFNREDYLPKSDLIALIESIPGVDSVNLYFVSEDVEAEINNLINATQDDINNNSLLNSKEKDLTKAFWLTTTVLSERTDFLFSLQSFTDFVSQHIDESGDVVIAKNEIPIVRGGFKDRNNRFYSDELNSQKLSSVNITFVKENLQTRK